MNETKRLYRSRTDRQLSGVCAGLAEFFDIDPTLVRILFVVMALAGGPGLFFYIILAMIIPEEPRVIEKAKRKIDDII